MLRYLEGVIKIRRKYCPIIIVILIMKGSPAKLWKQIGSEPIQTLPLSPKVKNEVKNVNWDRKQKCQQISALKVEKSIGGRSFSQLDISQIQLEAQYGHCGEVTNIMGWNQACNLENLLHELSEKSKVNTQLRSPDDANTSVKADSVKYLRIFRMFSSVLKNLKQQLLHLKKLFTKEHQKQRLMQLQLVTEFDQIKKHLQSELAKKNQQIQQRDYRIAEILTLLKVKQLQKEVCVEEKLKIGQQNCELKLQISALKKKISSLQLELFNKADQQEGRNNYKICGDAEKLAQFQKQGLFKDKVESIRLQRRDSLKDKEKEVPKMRPSWSSGIWQAENEPEDDEDRRKTFSQICGHHVIPRHHFTPSQNKTKTIQLMGEKLSKMRTQIEDEIKYLKSSVSTNI